MTVDIRSINQALEERRPSSWGEWADLVVAYLDGGEDVDPERFANTLARMGKSAEELDDAAKLLERRRELAAIYAETDARQTLLKAASKEAAGARALLVEVERRQLVEVQQKRDELADMHRAAVARVEECKAARKALMESCPPDRRDAWKVATEHRNATARKLEEMRGIVNRNSAELEKFQEAYEADNTLGAHIAGRAPSSDVREEDEQRIKVFAGHVKKNREDLARLEREHEEAKQDVADCLAAMLRP